PEVPRGDLGDHRQGLALVGGAHPQGDRATVHEVADVHLCQRKLTTWARPVGAGSFRTDPPQRLVRRNGSVCPVPLSAAAFGVDPTDISVGPAIYHRKYAMRRVSEHD